MQEHHSGRLLLNGFPLGGRPSHGRSVPPPGGLRCCRCMAEKPVIILQWLRRNTMANAMGSRNLASWSSRPIRKRGRLATIFRRKLCSLAVESTTGSEDGRLAKPSGHGRACLGRRTVVCKSRNGIQFGSLAQKSACEKGH